MSTLSRQVSKEIYPQLIGWSWYAANKTQIWTVFSPLNKVMVPKWGAYTWKGRWKETQKPSSKLQAWKKKNQTELKGGKQRFCFCLLIPAEAFYVHLTEDIWLPRLRTSSVQNAAWVTCLRMLQPGLASDDFSHRDDNNEDNLEHVRSTWVSVNAFINIREPKKKKKFKVNQGRCYFPIGEKWLCLRSHSQGEEKQSMEPSFLYPWHKQPSKSWRESKCHHSLPKSQDRAMLTTGFSQQNKSIQ